MRKSVCNGAVALAALGVSLALYGGALGLAFVNDDLAHLLSLQGTPFLALFTAQWAAQGSVYYRPLGSLALWLISALFGSRPLPFYALSISLHALNGFLLWRLAGRITTPLAAGGAALAWMLFPTHYEAVAYVAALFHPLSTLLTLGALSAYDAAINTGQRGWWLATGLLVLAAPFAHEQAAVLPALLVGWHLARRPPASVRQLVRVPALYFLPLVLPILALRAAGGGALTDAVAPSLTNTWAGLVHLARLASYPLAWLLGALELSAAAQAMVGAGAVTLALGLAVRRQRAAPALWGLGWLLVTGAPMLLLLESRYLPTSPRLHYLPSVGIALLWSCLLPQEVARLCGRASWPRSAALGVWVALVCLGPLPYVRCAMRTLARGSAVVRAMVVAANELGDDQGAIYVNAPFFLTTPCGARGPCRGAYPYDTAAVVILPLYAQVADLIRLNGGPWRPLQAVSYDGYAPHWAPHGPPSSALMLRRALDHGMPVLVVDAERAEVHDLAPAWASAVGGAIPESLEAYLRPLLTPPELAMPEELAAAEPAFALWPDLALVGARWDPSALPGEELTIALYWQPLSQEALEEVSVLLRLRDRYGTVLVQGSGALVPGYTTDLWEPGLRYATRLRLPVPPNATLGPATLELQLYQEGELLAADVCEPCSPEGWAVLGAPLIGREQIVESLPAHARRVGAVWENGIHLEGWLLGPTGADELDVLLYWRAERHVGEDLTVFLHLSGPDGVPRAQHDGEPARGLFPTSQWPVGALVEDSRTLRLPSDADRSDLLLVVGLYRWPSLERLRLVTGGTPGADHLLLGEIARPQR